MVVITINQMEPPLGELADAGRQLRPGSRSRAPWPPAHCGLRP